MAGDFYHQQAESVPEQTWSSAAFLSSAVHGLLGLNREGNRLEFSPHLPPEWNTVSVENIKIAGGTLKLTLSRVPQGLQLDAESSGRPVELLFAPEIPLQAHLSGAELKGKPVTVRRDDHPQDTHATVTFSLPPRNSHCLIRFVGGVSLSTQNPTPLPGEASKGVKITSVSHVEGRLVIEADVSQDGVIELRTRERPLKVIGAKLTLVADGLYDLTIDPPPAGTHHTRVIVDLASH
jgi:hypothetical protein